MEHIFTDQNFEQEVLKSSTPVLIDFWAEWCGPCRSMSPIIEEIGNEVDATKLKIGKMNVDQSPETPQKYGVSSIPTFLVIKDGQIAEQFMGSMPKSAVMEKLQKYLA
ncbi:thioredoxin [Patescibacteria group bacterium]|nr:thioredoxin [Patescibacteria group bacterium]